MGLLWASHSTLIYTSEFIICSTIFLLKNFATLSSTHGMRGRRSWEDLPYPQDIFDDVSEISQGVSNMP